MISVEQAVDRIASAFRPVASEPVAIEQASGRVLAEDVVARASQPPDAVSAMDGYAVRSEDTARPGASLRVVGSAPAGHPFPGRINPGEAVRIFTGGVVPAGADAIVIQEDTDTDRDGNVRLNVPTTGGRHIRDAGLDFKQGETLLRAGRRLAARDLSLLAAADLSSVMVRRRPIVKFAATGDELSRPGEPRRAGGIVASSGYALAALVTGWGAKPIDLGILPDTLEAVASIAAQAKDADLVLTLGGASVGDHDLVQKALGPEGFALDFWKVAMRPGKPLIFGRLAQTPLVGLPGNPVSTIVCALLFVRPAIAALLGTTIALQRLPVRLARELAANDSRQDYIRASLSGRNGELWAEPFLVQDSSMLSLLSRADCLVVRAPGAPRAQAGETVEAVLLD
jgi:molybdopterin molybdotransferase